MLRGVLVGANPVRVSCHNRSACMLNPPWGIDLTRAVSPPLGLASEYRRLGRSGTGGGDIWGGHLATLMSQTGATTAGTVPSNAGCRPEADVAGGFGLLRYHRRGCDLGIESSTALSSQLMR